MYEVNMFERNATHYSIRRTAFITGICVLLLSGYGCATAPDAASQADRSHSAQAEAASAVDSPPAERRPEFISTVIDARPAAIINGRRVDWGEIKPLLTEAAGGTIIREYALDMRLKEELRDHGITITADFLASERRLMLEMLHDDPDQSIRLLRELRARQGLGSHRFESLLRRNASLRALVQDQVEITETQIGQMYDVVYGTRRQTRLMTLPTLREARDAIDRIEQGEFFGDVAVDVSTDASAARGGLLEPITLFDPSYPEALRRALWGLERGDVSSPIMLDEQYAVIQFIAEFAGEDVALDDVRDELERRVRLNQERALMDRLARHLLVNSSFNLLDDALKESWEMRRQTETIQ